MATVTANRHPFYKKRGAAVSKLTLVSYDDDDDDDDDDDADDDVELNVLGCRLTY